LENALAKVGIEHDAADGRALHARTVSVSGGTVREAAVELEIVRVTGPHLVVHYGEPRNRNLYGGAR
jgi:hypothetical protein